MLDYQEQINATVQTLNDIKGGRWFINSFTYPFESEEEALYILKIMITSGFVINYNINEDNQVVACDDPKPSVTMKGQAYADYYSE